MRQERKGTSVLLVWTTTPNGIEIELDEVPLRGQVKVEAHGGIQALYQLKLEVERMEGPCLWKRLVTQDE